MYQAIAGGIAGLVSPIANYFTRKRELKSQEHENALKLMAAEGERHAHLILQGLAADMQWEQAMTEQAATGWKDEVTFLAVLTPFWLCFISWGDFDGAAVVDRGFKAIDLMPDWFVLLATVIFFANYGIRFWRRSQYDTPATPPPPDVETK
jgi:hypothetical protein